MAGLSSLNPEQKQVVLHEKGPLLVLSGAGTGKTKVITERIIHLIEERGYKPREILALTFTDKAALEMMERVDVELPLTTYDLWISTFHAFCDRILRSHSFHLGLDSSYKVINEAETQFLLKDVLDTVQTTSFSPPNNPTKFLDDLVTFFNRLRDENVSVEDFAQFVEKGASFEDTTPQALEELSLLYSAFQEEKKTRNLVDYADLIFLTLQLFRERKEILNLYQRQFREILVDEYQDTNYVQLQLVKILAGDDQNLIVVGDDDQSIFRWRGAAVYNILDFEKHFPGNKTITLRKNYRSAQVILDAAYRLIIHNNPNRLEDKIGVNKKLVAQRKIAGRINVMSADSAEHEAESVAVEIEALVASGKYSWRDIAVLTRANNHADPFVASFNRKRLPWSRSGVNRWFQQPIIKDLVAFLNVLADPTDNASCYRVLTTPNWRFPGRDLSGLVAWSRNNNKYLFDAAFTLACPFLSAESVAVLARIGEVFERWRSQPRAHVGRVLYDYLMACNLLRTLKDAQQAEELYEAELVARFFDEVVRFESQGNSPFVVDFLEYLELLFSSGGAEADFDNESNSVKILTFHSVKGLEFPVVFMVSLVDGRFPSLSRRDPLPLPEELVKEATVEGDLHLEEERRLFYVGMTRAMELLYLSFSRFYGEGKRLRKPSLFITEAMGPTFETSARPLPKAPDLFDLPIFSEDGSEKSGKSTLINQDKKVEYTSYSKLDTFSVCPLQYKYRHILQLPTLRSSAATFGTVLHLTLKDFYMGLMSGSRWGWEELISLYLSHWSSEGYTSKKLEERQKREGEVALLEFFKRAHDPKHLPKYVEYPFRIKLGKIVLSGTVDRIDEFEDGSVEIIDYKTSKPLDEKQLANDTQLSIYAFAVSSEQFLNIPLEKQTLSIYNFEDHTKRSTTRSQKDIEKVEKFVFDQVEKIERSNFPPKVSPLCKFCSYQILCDAYQGSGKY